jgi:hypothetical protein
MGAGGVIAAVAVGGGLAYVLVRAMRASQLTPSQQCDSLPAGVVRDTCKASAGILGIVKGIGNLFERGDPYDQTKKNDAANTALNGAPDVVSDRTMPVCTSRSQADANAHRPYMNKSSGTPAVPFFAVLRYKNGCVPFQGAPGWEKCVAGTKPMMTYAVTNASGHVADPKLAMTGKRGDPTTGFIPQQGQGQNAFYKCGGPAAPAQAGYYRGKRWECPAGTVPTGFGGDQLTCVEPSEGNKRPDPRTPTTTTTPGFSSGFGDAISGMGALIGP